MTFFQNVFIGVATSRHLKILGWYTKNRTTEGRGWRREIVRGRQSGTV